MASVEAPTLETKTMLASDASDLKEQKQPVKSDDAAVGTILFTTTTDTATVTTTAADSTTATSTSKTQIPEKSNKNKYKNLAQKRTSLKMIRDDGITPGTIVDHVTGMSASQFAYQYVYENSIKKGKTDENVLESLVKRRRKNNN